MEENVRGGDQFVDPSYCLPLGVLCRVSLHSSNIHEKRVSATPCDTNRTGQSLSFPRLRVGGSMSLLA